MKKIFPRIGHFCGVSTTGFIIVGFYGYAAGFDEHTVKISGIAVLLIAWMLEQRHADDEINP